MLTYEPGSSVAHRLDPRAKLAFQIAFAVAAFAHTTPRGLAVLSLVALLALWVAATPLWTALRELRVVLAVLLMAPILEGLVLGPPWFSVAEAVPPALASYRAVIIVLVAATYVRTTPARASRAAIQRVIPGKPGQVLGMGVSLVFRFLPVLLADVRRMRMAMQARLGTERSIPERASILALSGLSRAFSRADTLSLAMQARCFAWNPTLPRLRFSRLDAVPLLAACGLVATALI
ncbi:MULTISPECIES: energy-coupling factor transporter transmembrane protein EcfT [unclassified Haladaptatus]|uniref:energy-coupling factor transporter transmembrane component T family protein n=1 Tax=unclassified Haladaptatus TaxID=2622732 RepID=UPI0023E8CD9D|nr:MULTISPECIES: energy-coupling factor transporter transmembrane protein EcfT [unclassified Haladaptatus]